MTNPEETQRIDKWLWHTRFFKTRSLAQRMVSAGKVRIDGGKATSVSQKIRVSNVLTITFEREVRIIEVSGLPKRRGPYQEAQTFYVDRTQKPRKDDIPAVAHQEEVARRPTKRERRKILELKHNSGGA